MSGEAFVVAGPAHVRVGTASAGALEDLGYTVRGADVRLEDFEVPLHTDQNGGEQGEPADFQHLGTKAVVRLELTKVVKSVVDKLRAGLRGITPGTIPDAGTLVFADSRHFQLLIDAPADPHWFPRAKLVGQPREYNVGVLHQRTVLEFHCFRDPSTKVLYSTSYASTTTTPAPTTTTAGG